MADHRDSDNSEYAESSNQQAAGWSAPNKARSGKKGKGPATRSKAQHSKSTSSASDKDAEMRQKALEKHFAQKQAEASHAPRASGGILVPSLTLAPPLPLPVQDDQVNWSPTLIPESQQSQDTPFQRGNDQDPQPSTSGALSGSATSSSAPSATFTPTAAAGIRLQSSSEQVISAELYSAITQTIAQGIDTTLKQRGLLGSLHSVPELHSAIAL